MANCSCCGGALRTGETVYTYGTSGSAASNVCGSCVNKYRLENQHFMQ